MGGMMTVFVLAFVAGFGAGFGAYNAVMRVRAWREEEEQERLWIERLKIAREEGKYERLD